MEACNLLITDLNNEVDKFLEKYIEKLDEQGMDLLHKLAEKQKPKSPVRNSKVPCKRKRSTGTTHV